jgi:hypothetical protein
MLSINPKAFLLVINNQRWSRNFSALITPKLKMSRPFLVLETLTGFDFQLTKVYSHFCELV